MVTLCLVWKAFCSLSWSHVIKERPRLVSSLENSTTHITTTGSLVFQDFEEGMTGAYTCFLEYKPTVEEAVKNVQLKFIVYGKRCTSWRITVPLCFPMFNRVSTSVLKGLCSFYSSGQEELLAASVLQTLCEDVREFKWVTICEVPRIAFVSNV